VGVDKEEGQRERQRTHDANPLKHMKTNVVFGVVREKGR